MDNGIPNFLLSKMSRLFGPKFPRKCLCGSLFCVLPPGNEAHKSTPNMTGRRFRRTMEVIPALPWQSKSPSVSTPTKQSTRQGDAKGASEVRHGTSSIHVYCPTPQSSSHIEHGIIFIPGPKVGVWGASFFGVEMFFCGIEVVVSLPFGVEISLFGYRDLFFLLSSI